MTDDDTTDPTGAPELWASHLAGAELTVARSGRWWTVYAGRLACTVWTSSAAATAWATRVRVLARRK